VADPVLPISIQRSARYWDLNTPRLGAARMGVPKCGVPATAAVGSPQGRGRAARPPKKRQGWPDETRKSAVEGHRSAVSPTHSHDHRCAVLWESRQTRAPGRSGPTAPASGRLSGARSWAGETARSLPVHNPLWKASARRDLVRSAEHHAMTTVFTIGYEARDVPRLVSDLAAAGVELLVDVRELPLSRRRGFSKTALRAAVEDAGIAYLHDRAVGNPKPFRDAWKSGDTATGTAGYIAHLDNGSRTSVDALAQIVAQARVCIMCVEHDPLDCHRSLLVDALRQRVDGLVVEHL